MAGDRVITNVGPPRSDALGVAWVGRVVVGGDAHDDLVLSGLPTRRSYAAPEPCGSTTTLIQRVRCALEREGAS